MRFFRYSSDVSLKPSERRHRYPEIAEYPYACSKACKMRASPTWSICLIWLAALLSPIQALQGTPVLCHSGHACRGGNETAAGQPVCCPGESIGAHARRLAGCGALSDLVTLDQFASPAVPCNCPPNCWCQQPEEPQSSPPQLLRLLTQVDRAISTPSSIPSTTSLCTRYRQGQRSERTPISAQQFCAVLCCFLA